VTRLLRRLPGLLWHAVVLEVAMDRNLLRWVVRRPSVGAGDEPVGYARLVTPVMWLWIGASAAEIPVAHVLLPWHTVRVVLVVLGVWGLVWMLGLLAGLHVYPHLLTPTSLRIRDGAFVDVEVPWSAVGSVTTREEELPSTMRSLQPLETPNGTDLRVGVSGRVNVQVRLRAPLALATRKGALTVSQVSFWADEPRAVATRIRARADTDGATLPP
jgi:hypothetical protein